MKRLSWKYVAGLIDGEGCIDLQHIYHREYPDKHYYTPRVRVTLVESCRFVLEILQNNYGGSFQIKDRNFENPVWQNAVTWTIQGKKIRPFLQNIVNHLLIKKEQAKFCIWIIDNVMGKHTDEVLRESIHNELKAMKRDPHRLSEKAVLEITQVR